MKGGAWVTGVFMVPSNKSGPVKTGVFLMYLMIWSFVQKEYAQTNAYNWSIKEILLTGTISKPRGTSGGWKLVWERSENWVTGGGRVLGNSWWLVGWNSGWITAGTGPKQVKNWLLEVVIAGKCWWRWGFRVRGQEGLFIYSFWALGGELRTLSCRCKPPTRHW